MTNTAQATRKEDVERKTTCATCTRTRAVLQRDVDVSLNEFLPGAEWTLFYSTSTRVQQNKHKGAPSTQDVLSSRILRPERKTLGASGTAARGRDDIL